MSTLIKGRKKPDRCLNCFCLNDEYFYCQAVGRKPSDDNLTKTPPDWCPLIEIPKHGRLIDADTFDERIRIAGGLADEELSDDFKDGVQTTLLMLKTHRTIIPASEEGET